MYCCLLPPSSYKQNFCLSLKQLLRKLTSAALTYMKLMILRKKQNTNFYRRFDSETKTSVLWWGFRWFGVFFVYL